MTSLAKSIKPEDVIANIDPLHAAFDPAGASAAATLDTALGGVKPPPAMPATEAAPPMPLPDDDATKRARRRSIAELMKRRGRASTILTDTGVSDALGG